MTTFSLLALIPNQPPTAPSTPWALGAQPASAPGATVPGPPHPHPSPQPARLVPPCSFPPAALDSEPHTSWDSAVSMPLAAREGARSVPVACSFRRSSFRPQPGGNEEDLAA